MQLILEETECLLKLWLPIDSFLLISNFNAMGLIKEPKNVDLSTKSEEWTAQELADFRKLMKEIKAKNTKRKSTGIKSKRKKIPA